MIEIDAVLSSLPHFAGFCSLQKLEELVERLRSDERFEVRVAGTSVAGRPINHVRFGSGSVRALLLGFPHPMEPIGGMTVFALLTLLQQGNAALLRADVEWHVVTCADPDGALLNETWTQRFSIDRFLTSYYMPTMRDQAAMSFPIAHKKLLWNTPSKEASVVMRLLVDVKPDFYFTLHNTRAGGLFVGLSRDIGRQYHGKIHQLMKTLKFPIQRRPPYKEVCTPFAEGISELVYMKRFYDYIEKFTPNPEENRILRDGANEWDYLRDIDPAALCMIAETGCVRHPYDESERMTNFNLRRLKLHVDSVSKYFASVLLDEWSNVKDDVDDTSPFYRAVVGYVLPPASRIAAGGWPLSRYPTAEILGDPHNNRLATEGEIFNACVMEGGLYYLQYASPFIRLLETSKQTHKIVAAMQRTRQTFNDACEEVSRYIAVDAFEPFDYDTLVKVQLGSGLVVLNSILERRA